MTHLFDYNMAHGRCPFCHGASHVFYDHIADKRKQRDCPLCGATGCLQTARLRIAQGKVDGVTLSADDRDFLDSAKAAVVAYTLAHELDA